MGRHADPIRAAARAARERFYCDPVPCPMCGTTARYTANGTCVECAKAKGSARYAQFTEEQLAEQKQRDRERYLHRKNRVDRYADLP